MFTESPIIEISDLKVSYNGTVILENVNMQIGKGERWAIAGKNGAGKSTLIKSINGFIRPAKGSIHCAGEDIFRISSRNRAKLISYVPQNIYGDIPYTVYDYVMLSRFTHMGWAAIPCGRDNSVVENALDVCDVKEFLHRRIDSLSGGERQRVVLAGAVAQEAQIMLLDEPTTYLDPAHVHLFYETLDRIHENRPLTTVMVTHDINEATNRCTHIYALKNCSALFSGECERFKQQSPEILETIFEVPFREFTSEDGSSSIFTTGVNQ